MPGEERAGARALRDIYRRRHRRTLDGNRRRHREALDGRSSNSNGNKPNRTEKDKGDAVKTRDAVAEGGGDFHRRPLQQQHQHGWETAITWPEFVGAFIPLGRLAFEGGAHVEQEEEDQEQGRGVAAGEESNRGSGRGSLLLLTRRGCGNNGTTTSGEGLVDEDEMQLLRVAFATTAGRGGGRIGVEVVVSLAELRAASSALDGEDPPEGAVRKALGVSNQYSLVDGNNRKRLCFLRCGVVVLFGAAGVYPNTRQHQRNRKSQPHLTTIDMKTAMVSVEYHRDRLVMHSVCLL